MIDFRIYNMYITFLIALLDKIASFLCLTFIKKSKNCNNL